MLTREFRFFATSDLLLYRAPEPPPPPCPPPAIVHAKHTTGGHAGAGAPLDPGEVPVNPTPPPPVPPAFALSSDTAPVIESGPAVVGDWLHGTVAS